jgi:rubredoxin
MISAKVLDSHNYGSHTVFIADVVEAFVLSDNPSVTYKYYLENIKPKPHVQKNTSGYVCKICGYVHEGDKLPADFICPLCKHGVSDFEVMG